MPRLTSFDILNAPSEDVSVSVPAGGIFILKQLLSQWIEWDTSDQIEVDSLDAILSKTIALRSPQEAGNMAELVFEGRVPSTQGMTSSTFYSNINAPPVVINTDVCTWDVTQRRLTILQDGLYAVSVCIRILGSMSPTPPWPYLLQSRLLSGLEFTEKQITHNLGDESGFLFHNCILSAGDVLMLRIANLSGGNVQYYGLDSYTQIVKM